MIVVFDVETKKAFDEVGGYYPEKLGVSLVGVWKGEIGDEGEFVAYREEDFGEMFKVFERADLIVGFNSIGFDYPALKPYYSGELGDLPSLDLLQEAEKVLGHRVSLDSIAKETLGVGKSGHGLDAIRYYHDGDWESLEKYCIQDVKVTRDVYMYALEHKKLIFKNKWNRIVEFELELDDRVSQKKVQTTLF